MENIQAKTNNTANGGKNIIALDHLRNVLSVRYSARAFLPEVLSRERIERLLEAAALSPSWCNTQPWKAYVASSTTLNEISKDLVKAARDRCDTPDIPFISEYPEPYQSRKQEADEALRLARGINPTDYRSLVHAVYANWRFFDAPQALFLTVPASFGPYALLDLGCFLQSFLLACVTDNLAACPQASLAQYPEAVRRNLPIEADELIACGVSFGVPDPNAGANKYRTSRIGVSDFVHFQE